MFGIHIRVFQRMRRLIRDPGGASAREFQILHGVCALLMIVIVIAVIVKP
jgi:uncharacterized membrane protein